MPSAQVMHLVLHGAKRGLAEPRVGRPHGAERGFDPFQAFSDLDEANLYGYLLDPMPARGSPSGQVRCSA